MSNTLRGNRSFVFAILLAAAFMGTAACDESVAGLSDGTQPSTIQPSDDQTSTAIGVDEIRDEDSDQARDRTLKVPARF